MNLFIESFTILCPERKMAFNENFSQGINLIVGEKDTGKTTLSRSILYTFGCDVKDTFISSNQTNIYIMNFCINNHKYILIRKKLKKGRGKNFFKLFDYKNDKFYTYFDTKSFKEKLNQLLNIKLITLNKEGEETKLYPNHIFLPFYIDQDNSWQTYLKDTFNYVDFIKNFKKVILEYFTGARSNEYYELKLNKDILSQKLNKINSLINSKKLIIEENLKNIKIIEDIDIENFKKNYDIVLEIFDDVIEKEHYLKKHLNEKIFEKNTLEDMNKSIDNSINEMIPRNLNQECPTCHQNIINSLEENYNLLLVKQNLIKEKEKIDLELNDVKGKIMDLYHELEKFSEVGDDYKRKLSSEANVISLAERADSYALNRVNLKFENELRNDKKSKIELEEKYKIVESELNKLNSIDIASKYQKLMIEAFMDLNIQFSYKSYYQSNLESVNIILSGASKVQAFIAQYITIYKMSIENENVVHLPLFIDTFLKDDFNNVEIFKTANFIFSSLEKTYQSFIFIADNEQTLDSIEKYSFNKLVLTKKYDIFNKNYEEVYDNFKWVLENNTK